MPIGVVADRDDAADEAVDEVVRREPAEALVADAPDVLAPLDARPRRDSRPVLTSEVDEPGEDARGDGDAARRARPSKPSEKTRGAASDASVSVPTLKSTLVERLRAARSTRRRRS